MSSLVAQALPISDDMRKVRIAGDVGISRYRPGWYCLVFHQGEFLAHFDCWILVYSMQMTKESAPFVCHVVIERVLMADSSKIWGASRVNDGLPL